MSHPDSARRAAFISGLCELARYLKSNPDVPVPLYPTVNVFPKGDDWAAMRAEIDTIAALIGAIGHTTSGGHYVATRSFGSIEYRAIAIPPKNDHESE